MNVYEAAWDDGYDIDWNKVQYMDTVIEEGGQDFEEETTGETPFPSTAAQGENEEENDSDCESGGDDSTSFVHIPQDKINK